MNGWRNTLARSFLHRSLWLNDPDCVMLRRSATELSADASPRGRARSGCPGGWRSCPTTWRCSTAKARALLDEVIALGRASDAEARAGTRPAAPTSWTRHCPPGCAPGRTELVADPAAATSRLGSLG